MENCRIYNDYNNGSYFIPNDLFDMIKQSSLRDNIVLSNNLIKYNCLYFCASTIKWLLRIRHLILKLYRNDKPKMVFDDDLGMLITKSAITFDLLIKAYQKEYNEPIIQKFDWKTERKPLSIDFSLFLCIDYKDIFDWNNQEDYEF